MPTMLRTMLLTAKTCVPGVCPTRMFLNKLLAPPTLCRRTHVLVSSKHDVPTTIARRTHIQLKTICTKTPAPTRIMHLHAPDTTAYHAAALKA